MLTVKQIINAAYNQLPASSTTRLLDIELLLAHVLDKDRVFLKTWPDHLVPLELQHEFSQLLARRIAGEPIAYILGSCEFWDLQLKVNPAVLIPRPETEHLVECALEVIGDGYIRILDLGTGSGAVACALAKHIPQAQVVAVDSSRAALNVAADNAESLKLNNMEFLLGNWFEPLQQLDAAAQKFFCIVSNPPYIAADDPHLAQAELQFEPQQALVAADDGYSDLRHIINNAKRFLSSPGWLLLEHGYNQGPMVRELLTQADFAQVFTREDLAGNARISGGTFT